MLASKDTVTVYDGTRSFVSKNVVNIESTAKIGRASCRERV